MFTEAQKKKLVEWKEAYVDKGAERMLRILEGRCE